MRYRILLVLCVLLALAGTNAIAGKGGGKGKPKPPDDGDPPPAGTVYFFAAGEGYHQMDASGGGKSYLFPPYVDAQGARPDRGVRPSHLLHGGDRWFLAGRWTSEVLADGVQARELLAVREDGHEVLLWQESGARVRTRAWGGDDSFLSFTIVRPSDGTSRIVRGDVDWTGGEPSVGALTTAVVGSFDTQRQVNSLGTHSWAPDGSKIVYAEKDFSSPPPAAAPEYVYVRDVSAGTATQLASGGNPQWAPDGLLIAFENGGSVFTVESGGGSAVQVTDDGAGPRWAPDSSRLVVHRMVTSGKGRKQTTAEDVIRMPASGGEERNLTTDTSVDARPLAWR